MNILSCHPFGAKMDHAVCYNHDVPSGLKKNTVEIEAILLRD
jgi:hypothetical protein